VPWQLAHCLSLVRDSEAGQQVGGRSEGILLDSPLLSRSTGEIPAENCPTRECFAALHVSKQSSFWPMRFKMSVLDHKLKKEKAEAKRKD